MFFIILSLIISGVNSLYFNVNENLPSIYVLEDPLVNWSYLVECYEDQYGISPLDDERVEHAQNTAEIWMYNAALIYENRVYDIEEADFIYVPMMFVLSSDFEIRSGSLDCNGKTHPERVEDALDFIVQMDSYKATAGSNFILACTWFWAGQSIGNRARVIFSRSFIGINEMNNDWAKWECLNKIITIPYVSSSVVAKNEDLNIERIETRDIPFFFAGSSRGKPDRMNLEIVNRIAPGSQIHISDNWWKWSNTPEEFSDTIYRSKFCFIPRGDTLSSRRLFDAISGGCIPIITKLQLENDMVPFSSLLDYNEFCVVVHEFTFIDKKRLSSLIRELMKLDEEKYFYFQEKLNEARLYLTYGKTDSEGKLYPKKGPFNSFMQVAAQKTEYDGAWFCEPTPFYLEHAERISTPYFPPSGEHVQNWVSGTEILVNREHGFLICSVDYTNSEFASDIMLYIDDKSTWKGKNKDENNGVDFLKITDYSFYDIFMGVDWIKTIYYRDPVVRVLDIFTDTVSLDPEQFKNFVSEMYKDKVLSDSYRTISSHCGFRYIHYPTLLQGDDGILTSMVKTLHEPISSISDGSVLYQVDEVKEKLLSCEWSSFYDIETLNYIYELYQEDYDSFGIEKNWFTIFEGCG